MQKLHFETLGAYECGRFVYFCRHINPIELQWAGREAHKHNPDFSPKIFVLVSTVFDALTKQSK